MKKNILFLCTGNSCRSQMAEGWMRFLHGKNYDVFSAGTKPGTVNPLAIQVMNEAGVDISAHSSKSIGDLSAQEMDYVITVCDNARENCPFFPATVKLIHHSFDDPPHLAEKAKSDEDALDIYRRVRDEIRDYIQKLPTLLIEGKN